MDQYSEAAARRKRAIQLLAQAFNKPKPGVAPLAGSGEGEVRFLEYLQTVPTAEVERSVTDRLGVLAVSLGGKMLHTKRKTEPLTGTSGYGKTWLPFFVVPSRISYSTGLMYTLSGGPGGRLR